ncbi:SusD/RagB family nutrient-binding outer membrane lipoprotein [Flavivirga jejuensis]|uniref:SusD/RagB family nutrient-binding outer membrane lipoprotein n=1 Tax=Flavivirga jejuensis TaxID=870487 RepID=A0ABT8WJG5_9FLAO|nr:SusD/RagB family nutrient-binding outer membrane lipoprotein [Flavivirga jejuensis]MDO5973294.1 SusD/RagB family nutrient-binding outer membrane lipoprotein [Flavivirga jejuensis]
MKKIIYSLLAISFLLSSCEDQLDINRDPDLLSQDNAALSSEIAAGMMGIGATQNFYYAFIGGIWAQQWSQSLAASQYRAIDDYSIGTNDYTGGWSNMYDALSDIKNAKKLAFEQENWNYYLIASCLDVYASQIMTDFYNDIPYKEANLGIDNLQPNFNTGQEIYDFMIEDLDDALGRDLANSSLPAPGADDFMFSGVMARWVEFANTLKLKIYLRQTEARSSVAQAGITAMINANAAFLTVDAAIPSSVFKDEANASSPLYENDRRQLNTNSNLRASRTMWSYLDANSDPRLEAFYGLGNPLDQGDYNSDAAPNSVSIADISPLSPVFFISAAQSYFMQAEAMERYNGGTGAKALYDAGVAAAFEKSPNFFDDTKSEANQNWVFQTPYDHTPFIEAGGVYEYPEAGTLDDKLSAIITQKWISNYPDQGYESFFEQHRTGIPAVSAVPQTSLSYVPGEFAYSVNGVTGGVFPQRLVYPNTELSRNSNAPDIVEITVPVWWNN